MMPELVYRRQSIGLRVLSSGLLLGHTWLQSTGRVLLSGEVKLIDFSPGEKYLVTCAAMSPVTHEILMWGGVKEDKYFARIGKNITSVYETGTFTLIDKKSLKVENVVDFSWSPADPILALFVPELGGGIQPARVSWKFFLKTSSVSVIAKCIGKAWRIKERDIPIEVLELETKTEKIVAFAWEPKGHRFAIIHGDGPRPDISFYTMRTAQNVGRVQKLTTLKSKQANALYWFPGGRFIVLAGLKGRRGRCCKKNGLPNGRKRTRKTELRIQLRDGEASNEEEEYEAKEVEVEEVLEVQEEVR
ncbi:uncharacterized protein A4U43_C04F2480 [Asparagus officinalis]|uniref:Translation initiation factor beta propellor-like domain-containing protein n=1 Tax=Asparagus officinalis TaxID=4686 RepID=A0A5P1F353_ASPOF|nr:uncharacterized protein A4U43_C04F2480 [Asparagus officinalis]